MNVREFVRAYVPEPLRSRIRNAGIFDGLRWRRIADKRLHEAHHWRKMAEAIQAEVERWAMLANNSKDASVTFCKVSQPSLNYSGIWQWLKEEIDVRTVIDIGAHTGEFAEFLARFFEPSVIYAFEPLPGCQEELRQRAGLLGNFRIFEVALSDQEGEGEFFKNLHAPSSSLLPVSKELSEEFPATSRSSVTKVRLARLDDVLKAETLEDDVFIKIDVQGMEDRVIAGGRRVFGRARAVYIEMSFVELYQGQPCFEKVHGLLHELGFQLAGIKNQICSEKTGQPLFIHCVYRRPR